MEVTNITRKHRVSLFNAFTKAFGELEAELLKRDEEEKKKTGELLAVQNEKIDVHEKERSDDKLDTKYKAEKAALEDKVAALIKENEELKKKNSELIAAELSKQHRTQVLLLQHMLLSNANTPANTPLIQAASTLSTQHHVGTSVGAQTDADPVTVACPQYEELTRKYEQMRQQVKHYREAHTILAGKYRRNKEVWKQWVEDAKVRRQKSEQLKAQLNSARELSVNYTPRRQDRMSVLLANSPKSKPPEISSDVLASPVTVSKQLDSSPPRLPLLVEEELDVPPPPFAPEANIKDGLPVNLPAIAPGDEPLDVPLVTRPGELAFDIQPTYDSDETTDGEGELRAVAFDPISRAISEKERSPSPTLPFPMEPPVKIKMESQTADYSPVFIKSEPRSSHSMMDHIAFTQQSLDLDDIGHKPKTPRKRRYMTNYRSPRRTRPMEIAVHPNALQPRLNKVTMHQEQMHNGDDKEGDEVQNQVDECAPPPSFRIPTLPAPKPSGFRIPGIQVDSQLVDHPVPSPRTKGPYQSTLTGFIKHSDVLDEEQHGGRARNTDRSPPKRGRKEAVSTLAKGKGKVTALPRTSSPRRARSKRNLHSLDADIGLMTEDGANGAEKLIETAQDTALLTREKEELLGKLLDTPPPKVPSLAHIRRGTTSSSVTPARLCERLSSRFMTPVMNEAVAKKRNLPVTDPPVSKRSKLNTGSERKRRPHLPASSGSKTRTGSGALRNRSAKELSVTDFVINPEKARGHNFAYQEVIRKRDERKCLSGCMRPCCAGILKFLESAGMPKKVSNAPKWRSSPPVPELDEEGGRSDDEEEGEAGEGEGMMMGRQEDLFPRTNSPPGFWESEFPDTQEVEERRKAAREEEKKRVKEMRREAKKGGRYRFRDEV
ncbi:hypothetical protein BDZ91DRAFT_848214 [Kalaharituber pfeilii]|nr:hypothetical protein BDZ91DRAFT_848214 [Kalaharituber pfeilii]